MGLKNYYLILLCLFVISGCSLKDKRYDSIELIVYYWVDPKDGAEWILHCSTFALIDKEGYCNFIFKPYDPKTEIKYLKVKLDKLAINKILEAFEKITSEIDIRPDRPMLYDGPQLKIRMNKNDLSKTVHFIVDSNPMINDFLELYYFSVSKYNFSNALVLDTLFIEERKLDFIEYSRQSDYILRPPPRPQTEMTNNKE